jgi:hypothetical protein
MLPAASNIDGEIIVTLILTNYSPPRLEQTTSSAHILKNYGIHVDGKYLKPKLFACVPSTMFLNIIFRI